MCLLQNVNVNDQRDHHCRHATHSDGPNAKLIPLLCKGGLVFFCNFPVTEKFASLGTLSALLVSHEMWKTGNGRICERSRVRIAEDQHLTRWVQVCFTGTGEDQADKRDHGTIDEVLGDQDMEKGRDVLEEADREADLLEQMPLLGHPESETERLASWLRVPRRARVAIRRLHQNLRHLPREALVQMLRAARAPQDHISAAKTFRCKGCDNTKPRPQTQSVANLDPKRSITKWESMCSRSLTQSACASHS